MVFNIVALGAILSVALRYGYTKEMLDGDKKQNPDFSALIVFLRRNLYNEGMTKSKNAPALEKRQEIRKIDSQKLEKPLVDEISRRHRAERHCWILAAILITMVVVAVLASLVILLLNRTHSGNGANSADDTSVQQNDMRDALRFKNEYESLNNTVRQSDGATYGEIIIDEENPIVYVTPAEVLDILDHETAVIYVGAEWCPWCRNAVPVLLDVAKQYGVDKLYYLNLDEEKSQFEVENGELIQKRKGSEAYYRLLDKLKDKLRDYAISDREGNNYPTGEKRIYQPHVFGIKDGKVVADKSGTVELAEGQSKYDALSSVQKNELRKAYLQLFEKVYGERMETCSTTEQVCEQMWQ